MGEHLYEGYDPNDGPEEDAGGLPAPERTEHLAQDAGVSEKQFRDEAGEQDEPSGLADFGHALAPPG